MLRRLGPVVLVLVLIWFVVIEPALAANLWNNIRSAMGAMGASLAEFARGVGAGGG